MNRSLIALLLAVLGLSASGCIETQMLVTVNPDGSGSIEERVLMNKMVIEMFAGFGEAFKAEGEEAEAEEPKEPFSMFSKEDAVGRAAKMGEGVKLISYESAETSTGKGYNAYFTFDDINKVTMDQNPGSSLPEMPGDESSAESKEERVYFDFTPGSPARLVIKPPLDEEELTEELEGEMAGTDSDSESGESDEEFEQMKELFRGMRMNLSVKVKGEIKNTNASFVNGSTITLIDFNMDPILDNPELLKQLNMTEEMSPAAAQEVLKDIEGIKVDIDDEIVVTFE